MAIMATLICSCQKMEPVDTNSDNKLEFRIVAGTQNEISTYASDKGGTVNVDKNIYDQRYILEIYDGQDRIYRQVQNCEIGESISFDVRLLAKKYTLALWADFTPNGSKEDNLYNTADGLHQVTYREGTTLKMLSMDNADAYCHVEELDLSSSGISMKNIVMQRPLGKIRFWTPDASNTLTPVVSKISLSGRDISTTYNVLTGNCSGSLVSNEMYFEAIHETSTVNGSDNEGYLLGNIYVFADMQEEIYQTNITTYADDNREIKIGEHTLDIPVKRNKLTTVTGNFFN